VLPVEFCYWLERYCRSYSRNVFQIHSAIFRKAQHVAGAFAFRKAHITGPFNRRRTLDLFVFASLALASCEPLLCRLFIKLPFWKPENRRHVASATCQRAKNYVVAATPKVKMI
jgi:hypothetical protein